MSKGIRNKKGKRENNCLKRRKKRQKGSKDEFSVQNIPKE